MKYDRLVTHDELWNRNTSEVVFVTSGFDVTSVSREETEATVEVTFKVLGRIEATPPSLTEDRKRQTIKFRVVRVGSEWRIAPVECPWHVSPSVLLCLFRELSEDARSPEAKPLFRKVIRKLEALEKEAKKRP